MADTAQEPTLCGVCGLIHAAFTPCQNTGGPSGFTDVVPDTPDTTEAPRRMTQRTDYTRCCLCGSRAHKLEELDYAPIRLRGGQYAPACSICTVVLRRRARNGGTPPIKTPWPN